MQDFGESNAIFKNFFRGFYGADYAEPYFEEIEACQAPELQQKKTAAKGARVADSLAQPPSKEFSPVKTRKRRGDKKPKGRV